MDFTLYVADASSSPVKVDMFRVTDGKCLMKQLVTMGYGIESGEISIPNAQVKYSRNQSELAILVTWLVISQSGISMGYGIQSAQNAQVMIL